MKDNLGYLNMGLILAVAFILSREPTKFKHWIFGVFAIIAITIGLIDFIKGNGKQENKNGKRKERNH